MEACIEPGAADEAFVCFEIWREVRRRAVCSHTVSATFGIASTASVQRLDSRMGAVLSQGFHESTNPPEPYDAAMQTAVRAGDAEMANDILASASRQMHTHPNRSTALAHLRESVS